VDGVYCLWKSGMQYKKKVVEEKIINHRNAATGKGFEPF
jgi:hypothetical protein